MCVQLRRISAKAVASELPTRIISPSRGALFGCIRAPAGLTATRDSFTIPSVAAEWKNAIVLSFVRAQALGRVRLDDGTEMPFDVVAATAGEPRAGQAVRVKVGLGRLGRPKIEVLESLDSLDEADEPPKASFTDALRALRAEGLARALTPKVARAIAHDLFDDDNLDAEALVAVLAEYYGDDRKGAARARADKWLSHDWHFGQETHNVVAEFAALVGGIPLVVQVANLEREGVLRVQPVGGKVRDLDFSFTSRSKTLCLEDLATLFNELLAAKGDTRRFYSLETGGDWFAFYLLDAEVAQRLADVLPFNES